MTFIYETTVEMNGPEFDLRYFYNVSWGRPQTGPTMENSGGEPEEHPTVELLGIQMDDPIYMRKSYWRTCTDHEYDMFCEEVSDEDLIAHAREELSDV